MKRNFPDSWIFLLAKNGCYESPNKVKTGFGLSFTAFPSFKGGNSAFTGFYESFFS
jgi:hypothetical protein